MMTVFTPVVELPTNLTVARVSSAIDELRSMINADYDSLAIDNGQAVVDREQATGYLQTALAPLDQGLAEQIRSTMAEAETLYVLNNADLAEILRGEPVARLTDLSQRQVSVPPKLARSELTNLLAAHGALPAIGDTAEETVSTSAQALSVRSLTVSNVSDVATCFVNAPTHVDRWWWIIYHAFLDLTAACVSTISTALNTNTDQVLAALQTAASQGGWLGVFCNILYWVIRVIRYIFSVAASTGKGLRIHFNPQTGLWWVTLI
jgi:hypothetical protein